MSEIYANVPTRTDEWIRNVLLSAEAKEEPYEAACASYSRDVPSFPKVAIGYIVL